MPSAKVLESKQAQVKALSEKIKNSKITLFVEYKGITVDDDQSLRRAYRESGNSVEVVKNTLIKLAVKEAGIEGFDDKVLEG